MQPVCRRLQWPCLPWLQCPSPTPKTQVVDCCWQLQQWRGRPPPQASCNSSLLASGQHQGGGSRLPATDGLEDDDDDDDDEGYESGSVAEEEATEDGEDSLAPAATGVNRLRVECKACMQLGVFRKDGQPTTILAAPVYVRGHCRGLQWTNNDGRKDPAGYHKAWLAVMEEKWAWQKEEKAAAARKRKHAAK